MTLPQILYITFDGVLEPLGRSQVLKYLDRLGEHGFKFTVLSLEREHDLANSQKIEKFKNDLASRGVKWLPYLYRGGSFKGVLKNFFLALRIARLAVRQDQISLIHARSYVPAFISWILKRLTGVPYLFDVRGYWIDELADEGRWFKNHTAYRIGRWIERLLFREAAGIVTLTNLQARDLQQGELKNHPAKPIVSIPTCADYDEFAPTGNSSGAVPEQVRKRLQGKLVVGLVGSINSSYCIAESLSLFHFLLEARPDAHLLCLTRQLSTMESFLREHNISEEVFTLVCANHQDMPEWLRHMHWGLLILSMGFSKRGSMPTKLAEFFSSGVRPIQFGCNDEVSHWVRKAGSGIVLKGLASDDLKEAAMTVAHTELNIESALKARETTRPHFSLESGVNKYAELFDKLLLEDGK